MTRFSLKLSKKQIREIKRMGQIIRNCREIKCEQTRQRKYESFELNILINNKEVNNENLEISAGKRE